MDDKPKIEWHLLFTSWKKIPIRKFLGLNTRCSPDHLQAWCGIYCTEFIYPTVVFLV